MDIKTLNLLSCTGYAMPCGRNPAARHGRAYLPN
jgi:hypothetical protein